MKRGGGKTGGKGEEEEIGERVGERGKEGGRERKEGEGKASRLGSKWEGEVVMHLWMLVLGPETIVRRGWTLKRTWDGGYRLQHSTSTSISCPNGSACPTRATHSC